MIFEYGVQKVEFGKWKVENQKTEQANGHLMDFLILRLKRGSQKVRIHKAEK